MTVRQLPRTIRGVSEVARLRRGRRTARARALGLSLVETTALISLSGVLLAAFTPTFLRHVRLSKLAEATEQLEMLHQRAAAYYETTRSLPAGTVHGCLPESAGPFPSEPSPDPMFADFAATDTPGRDTWLALGLEEPAHLRYAYSIATSEPGCEPRQLGGKPAIVFRAEGDLDGDGQRSLIERSAVFSPDRQRLVASPILRIEKRIE